MLVPRVLVLGLGLLGACVAPSREPTSASEPSGSEGEATPTPVVVGEASEREPSEMVAASEPAAASEPTFEPATAGDAGCVVTVSALLEAEAYRGGGPMTPALAASLDADPEFARRYQAESHGDRHIQCVYRVELAHEPGKHYRWLHWFNDVMHEAEPSRCNTLAPEVARDIVTTTKDCSQLDAGAWWGQVLEPL